MTEVSKFQSLHQLIKSTNKKLPSTQIMSSPSSSTVKFVPFSSLVDTSFWHQLADKKLNEIKLDRKAIPATASYRNGKNCLMCSLFSLNFIDLAAGLPPLATFDFSSFRERNSSVNNHLMSGEVLITNTIEEFKSIDKQNLINEAGSRVCFESDYHF